MNHSKNESNNSFRTKEKYFQQKKRVLETVVKNGQKKVRKSSFIQLDKTELTGVLDVHTATAEQLKQWNIQELPCIEFESDLFRQVDADSHTASTSDPTTAPCKRTVRRFAFNDHPGLVLLANVLTFSQQISLARHCLVEWAEPPNKTNLTAHHGPIENLFARAIRNNEEKDCEKLLENRRWTTLGYQYDWTARVYNEDDFVPMPSTLCQLSAELAELAWKKIDEKEQQEYVAEAVIVNYYQNNSTICGHLDDAERFFDAPIVSISLGNECIFLLGSQDKADEPSGIALRSGDCIIMGGKSRQCYHGVPRIFSNSFNQQFCSEISRLQTRVDNHPEKELYGAVLRFLQSHRVNVNVRQVNPLTSALLKRYK